MRDQFAGLLLACVFALPAGAAQADAAASGPDSSAGCTATPYAMAVRFQSASAEIDALRYQAYNVATRQLDAILKSRSGQNDDKPPAVVLDLDETVLDNSPMEATAVTRCIDYTNWAGLWQQWVRAASAPLIPGAKAFLQHADAQGVSIYYVSDRQTANLDATVDNLRAHDLPQAKTDHVRLLGPPKTERRAAIAKSHDIVMLVGDSLHDFDHAFADASLARQNAAVERSKHQFGRRFIVLPNASYGSWTGAPLSAAPALSD